MEEPEKSKPWEKPWTTDEIRRESGNWSLAGDAGLLNHLQQFSQNLLQRTHSTEVSLNKLIEELKTTSTEISNVTNSFLALANTQFVENRVYDDDENENSSEDKKEEEKIRPKAQQEAEVVARIKEALVKGMALLDSHFDVVDVPASDSEEEESSASTGRVFLEARNPYMMRPLPCLIGSKEFMEDDHVGLGELQSDTEESPDQNLVQSSESEEDLEQGEFGAVPKRPRLSSSSVSENSEPESDRSGTQAKQKKHKVGNSHLDSADALEEEPDMFGRESPPESDVGTVTQRVAHSSFAAELASKLGGVVAESSIAQKQEQGKSDNLFSPSSEPEEDNSLFGNNAGKFSGGQGLFDDLDDWRKAPNSLWENSEETGSRKQAEKDPQVGSNNTFNAGSRSDDLFNRSSVDQTDDDDDDIFSTGVRSSKKSASTKVIRIVPNDGLPQQNVFTSTPTEVPAPTKSHSEGLFDEVENGDLFQNSDFSSKTGTPRMPKSSSLFDSTDMEDGDLFSVPSSSKKDVKIPQESTEKKIPVGGVPVKLFQSKLSPLAQQPSTDSSDDIPVEYTRSVPISGDSSSGIGKTGTFDSSQNIATGRISLFDSKEDELFQPELTSTKKSINEEDGSDSLFGTKSFRTPTRTGGMKPPSNLGGKDRKPVSLFDDSDSGDDEFLFSSTSSTSSRSRRSQGSGDLLAAEKKPLQKKGLFDDENALFGASQQDDPGFDIFSGDSGMKNNMNSVPKIVPEEKNTRSSLFDDNISGARKVSHGLFDDFSDPSDDIFAIPARTGGNSEKLDSSVKKALKNDLFADDVDSTVDIFQVSVPKVSNNLSASASTSGKSSSSVRSDITNSVLDSDATNSSTGITSVTHIGEISKAISLFDDPGTTVDDQEKSENKTSYKSLGSQKSKSSISKPSLFESSPEESDIFPVSSNVSSNQNKTETGVERLTKNFKQSENIHSLESQQEVVNNILEEKADQELHLKSGTDNTSQSRSEDFLQAPATAKPEPPRTLNIRKTTDMLFNDEEDLWTTGSLDEKVSGSAVDLSVGNEKALSSNTLSAILQDYSPDKVVDAPDGSIISVRKQSTAEEQGPTKAASATAVGSVLPQKTKSVETVSSIQSPRKLFIDPTALLPGAKPPSRSVNSEGGVSFDIPVDTNTVLHSASKERAKIQVKRRPQSRRARQEALRVSMDLENDDTLIERKNEEEIIVRKESLHNNNFLHLESKIQTEAKHVPSKPEVALKPSLSKTSEKEAVKGKNDSISAISGPNTPPDATSKPSVSDFLNGGSNPLSPSTDEEDFFAIPQDLPAEYGETKEQTSDERKNLFGGAPVISPIGLSARSTLFGDDTDTHSHHISSNDLFSENTEPSGSSKGAPLNISEPKVDPFSEKKENTLRPAGTKDLFDKADNSLDDDYDLFKSSESTTPKKSQNIFSSVENQLAPDEDLFSTSQSKQQTVPKADTSDKRSTNLFLSAEDELLFSNRNTNEFKKNVDNTSTMARNIKSGKDRGLLFSASESSSDDLFSVGNKSDISEAVVPESSLDSFLSREPGKVSDQLDEGTFASVQEQKTSLRANGDNLFSDITKEKNLFSSEAKSQVSKTNSDDESEASLFSNKGWSGGSRKISTTQSNSLFGDDSPESDDLFASSLSTAKRKISSEGLKEGVSAKGSLFEDDGGNIFEAKSTKSEPKLISSSVLEATEDSDLFSSRVSSKRTSVRTSKMSSTVVQGQKKEEDDLFEDPLMVIKK
ncbi:WASH complex subunit 2 [Anabrus simplex]|uniref:WASH complex subunit 2 n=1 Tax=Anabrus simplex TaxID=316456 RepID=UPI0035A2C6C6